MIYKTFILRDTGFGDLPIEVATTQNPNDIINHYDSISSAIYAIDKGDIEVSLFSKYSPSQNKEWHWY